MSFPSLFSSSTNIYQWFVNLPSGSPYFSLWGSYQLLLGQLVLAFLQEYGMVPFLWLWWKGRERQPPYIVPDHVLSSSVHFVLVICSPFPFQNDFFCFSLLPCQLTLSAPRSKNQFSTLSSIHFFRFELWELGTKSSHFPQVIFFFLYFYHLFRGKYINAEISLWSLLWVNGLTWILWKKWQFWNNCCGLYIREL